MKNITRCLLGLVTSLLLSVGFVHAAELMTQSSPQVTTDSAAQAAPDCAPCSFL